ncbi:MAG: TRAP transporter substrate-binding protein [Alphaproteobacteria bacterium]
MNQNLVRLIAAAVAGLVAIAGIVYAIVGDSGSKAPAPTAATKAPPNPTPPQPAQTRPTPPPQPATPPASAQPTPPPVVALPATPPPAADTQPPTLPGPANQWRMASTYPSQLPQYGTLGRKFVAKINRIGNGALQFTYEEPGNLISPTDCLAAVGQGKVRACWSSPTHWYGKEPALNLFGGAPFGPGAAEYAAWLYYGGGRELLDEIYARHGVKSIICGIVTPEAGGWFLKEIAKVEDLKDLRIRIGGLGSRVIAKLGAQPQMLKGSEIADAFRDNKLDAAEYSIPAIDFGLGMNKLAPFYYFPGWHQQTALLEILVNRKSWETVPERDKALIELACGDNFREGLAEGEALQAQALRELEAKGAKIRRLPPDVLKALSAAWLDIAKEEAASDPAFKRVWDAYSSFRTEYQLWRSMGVIE